MITPASVASPNYSVVTSHGNANFEAKRIACTVGFARSANETPRAVYRLFDGECVGESALSVFPTSDSGAMP